jgi:hypothetical protein
MRNLPFRTNTTWLTDDQLVLLDVLFDKDTPFWLLRREDFLERVNLGYAHNLDDGELHSSLRWLVEHGFLTTKCDGGETYFCMTAACSELWSQERCPVWERYCRDRYKTTSRGRTMMTVTAASARVRDDFLELWPPDSARRRTATITDYNLIGWQPFARVFVGVATYAQQQWTLEQHTHWVELCRGHKDMLGRERSWWRCVGELQRFVTQR